jgi:hypothetical protein
MRLRPYEIASMCEYVHVASTQMAISVNDYLDAVLANCDAKGVSVKSNTLSTDLTVFLLLAILKLMHSLVV